MSDQYGDYGVVVNLNPVARQVSSPAVFVYKQQVQNFLVARDKTKYERSIDWRQMAIDFMEIMTSTEHGWNKATRYGGSVLLVQQVEPMVIG